LPLRYGKPTPDSKAAAKLSIKMDHQSWRSPEAKELLEHGKWLPWLNAGACTHKTFPPRPAYKALLEKHSYTGPLTVFGHDYQANYAPLIGADGKLIGALFVGVPK
jgi:hypothetical protein